VLGVVYQPVTDKLYRGVVGAGAVLEHAGQRRALRVSERAEPSSLRLVVSRSHRSQSTDAVVTRLGIRDESASGSVGLKIGRIAESAADLYVHMSEAILHAAGGRFSDLFGAAIDYRAPAMANARGLLACNAAAYAAVLPVVRAAATDAGLGA
jgi:3'(2'), 5'-bisphosphate nucleotidase